MNSILSLSACPVGTSMRVMTSHASHALLTVHQPRLDCLSVHVFQATIGLLMEDLVWPALMSDNKS